MEGSDADLLALDGNILGGQHGGVGRGLITIGLDLHTTSDTGDGLTAGQIGDVDKGVVERGKDVGNTKDLLVTADLGTEGDVFLNLGGGLDLLGLLGGQETGRGGGMRYYDCAVVAWDSFWWRFLGKR